MQVAIDDGGGGEDVYDVHTDHLDTPRLLTDSGGVARWRAAYEAFGAAHLDPDPDGDANPANNVSAFNLRFPGQYYDAETGLHYNRFRYYDPEVGRYIWADPIGQVGGANLYIYARANPANRIDGLGLDPNNAAGKNRSHTSAARAVSRIAAEIAQTGLQGLAASADALNPTDTDFASLGYYDRNDPAFAYNDEAAALFAFGTLGAVALEVLACQGLQALAVRAGLELGAASTAAAATARNLTQAASNTAVLNADKIPAAAEVAADLATAGPASSPVGQAIQAITEGIPRAAEIGRDLSNRRQGQ